MNNNLLITPTFNTQFGECLDDISNLYPENSKFKKYKRYVDSIKKMNPSLLIKVWKQYVSDKYESQIEEGDVDYFLNKVSFSDLQKLHSI